MSNSEPVTGAELHGSQRLLGGTVTKESTDIEKVGKNDTEQLSLPEPPQHTEDCNTDVSPKVVGQRHIAFMHPIRNKKQLDEDDTEQLSVNEPPQHAKDFSVDVSPQVVGQRHVDFLHPIHKKKNLNEDESLEKLKPGANDARESLVSNFAFATLDDTTPDSTSQQQQQLNGETLAAIQEYPALDPRTAPRPESQPGAFQGRGAELVPTARANFSHVGMMGAEWDSDAFSHISRPAVANNEENSSTNGLAVATRVSANHDNSFPHAEEYDAESEPTSNKEIRIVAIGATALALAIFAVVVALLLILLLSDSTDGNAQESTLSSEQDYLLSLLPEYSINSIQQEEITPQQQAYNWLRNDPSMEELPDYRLVQRFALASFYYATNGDQWFNNTNWLSYDHHECRWFSKNASESAFWIHDIINSPFPCEDDDTEWIQHLWLNDNNLDGLLPDEMYLLTNLKSLLLVDEGLQGSTISTNIGTLSAIEFYGISNSGVEGTLPSEIGLLPRLGSLSLQSNALTGAIPSQLGLLSNVLSGYLSFESNQLSSSIPTEIGNLSQLLVFYIFSNNLSGNIPSELGQMPSLTDVAIDFNKLTGWIPSELGAMTNLIALSASGNELSGTIPTELTALNGSLLLLDVFFNQLTGEVPNKLCDIGQNVTCPFPDIDCGVNFMCPSTLCGCDCPC